MPSTLRWWNFFKNGKESLVFIQGQDSFCSLEENLFLKENSVALG